MKIICQGSTLSNAVQTVAKAASSKKGVAILETIKIETLGNSVMLSATDGDLSIQQTIIADVLGDGVCVVPVKVFGDFVTKFPSSEIELTLRDNILYASYGGNVCNFPCLNADDYPKIELVDRNNTIDMKVRDLKELINKTIYAVAIDDARPILKGCCVHSDNGYIVSVALDGHRMSIFKTDKYTSEQKDFSFIIPQRSLNEIMKILSDDEKAVSMILNETKLMIKHENTVIITKLIRGDFVNYKNIIPREFMTNIVINKAVLAETLSRILVIARVDKNNLVKFTFSEDLAILEAHGENAGDIEEKLAVNLTGKEIVIAFNVKFLIDMLNTIDEEYVSFDIKASSAAVIIRPVGNDNLIGLVLPLKIKD